MPADDLTISGCPANAAPAGTDVLPTAQAGATVKTSLTQISAFTRGELEAGDVNTALGYTAANAATLATVSGVADGAAAAAAAAQADADTAQGTANTGVANAATAQAAADAAQGTANTAVTNAATAQAAADAAQGTADGAVTAAGTAQSAADAAQATADDATIGADLASLVGFAALWNASQPMTMGFTRDGANLTTSIAINHLAVPVTRASGKVTALGGLSSAPAFARASASYNPETLALVASGTPRYVLDELGALSAIFIEKGAVNLVEYSEEFDNAWWTKSNLTVTPDAAVAPDGNTTADFLVENTANGYHELSRSAMFTVGAPATASVYAKAGGRSRIGLGTGLPSTNGAIFDLTAGTVAQVYGATTKARIEYMGDDVYRCSVSTPTASSTVWNLTLVESGTTQTYTGDGVSGVYLWGAQGVAGLEETSYLKTSGGTATRAIETLTLPTASVLRRAEGMVVLRFYMSQAMIDTAATIYRSLLDTRDGNYMLNIYKHTGSPGSWRINLRNAAGTIQTLTVDAAGLAVGWHTIGLKWNSATLKGYLDGAEAASAANTGMPEQFGASLAIGSNAAGTEQLGSGIALLAAYFEEPTDAEALAYTDNAHAHAGADFRMTFAADLGYEARTLSIAYTGDYATSIERELVTYP